MIRNAAENWQNGYNFEKKGIVSKLSMISIPNLNEAQIEDLCKDSGKIPRPYLFYFPRNKPLKSVDVLTLTH